MHGVDVLYGITLGNALFDSQLLMGLLAFRYISQTLCDK